MYLLPVPDSANLAALASTCELANAQPCESGQERTASMRAKLNLTLTDATAIAAAAEEYAESRELRVSIASTSSPTFSTSSAWTARRA